LFVEIIERFELQVGSSTGHDEVRKKLKAMFVPKDDIEFMLEKLSGWLVKEVMSKIKDNELAVVSWKDLSQQMEVCFTRIRRRELIDFAKESPPSNDEVKDHLDLRPIYVKQLDEIEATDDEIINAVTDYLRADINREKWIISGIIDEDAASDLEEKLVAFWENSRQHNNIIHSMRSDVDKGKLLHSKCNMRQETIQGQQPPASTISGTYHLLANEPILGWHTDWVKFKPQNEDK